MPAIDPYAGYANLPDGLYDNFAVVTPSDIVELEYVASKLFVWPQETATGEPASLRIIIEAPNGLAIEYYTRGGIVDWPTRIKKVRATGTEAKAIFAFW